MKLISFRPLPLESATERDLASAPMKAVPGIAAILAGVMGFALVGGAIKADMSTMLLSRRAKEELRKQQKGDRS